MTIDHPAAFLLFLGALCAFAAASPPTPRENIPVNSEVFVQPEYIEALDKELEREDPIYGGSWWIHYQQEQRKNGGAANAGGYRQSSWQHGNLDHIGGGNLLRRNLDPIGGGNLLRRNLDQIGGGNLVKRYLDDASDGNALRRSIEPIGGGNYLLMRHSTDERPKTERPNRPYRPGPSIGAGVLIRSAQAADQLHFEDY